MSKNLHPVDELMLQFERIELDCINNELREHPNLTLIAIGLLNHVPKKVRRELIEAWGLRKVLEQMSVPYFRYTMQRAQQRWSEAAASDPNERWRLEAK